MWFSRPTIISEYYSATFSGSSASGRKLKYILLDLNHIQFDLIKNRWTINLKRTKAKSSEMAFFCLQSPTIWVLLESRVDNLFLTVAINISVFYFERIFPVTVPHLIFHIVSLSFSFSGWSAQETSIHTLHILHTCSHARSPGVPTSTLPSIYLEAREKQLISGFLSPDHRAQTHQCMQQPCYLDPRLKLRQHFLTLEGWLLRPFPT